MWKNFDQVCLMIRGNEKKKCTPFSKWHIHGLIQSHTHIQAVHIQYCVNTVSTHNRTVTTFTGSRECVYMFANACQQLRAGAPKASWLPERRQITHAAKTKAAPLCQILHRSSLSLCVCCVLIGSHSVGLDFQERRCMCSPGECFPTWIFGNLSVQMKIAMQKNPAEAPYSNSSWALEEKIQGLGFDHTFMHVCLCVCMLTISSLCVIDSTHDKARLCVVCRCCCTQLFCDLLWLIITHTISPICRNTLKCIYLLVLLEPNTSHFGHSAYFGKLSTPV